MSVKQVDVGDPDTKKLVKRVQQGDREAAGLLFDEFHPRVYRYALAKLGDPHGAEDVAAETFARVLAQLGRFRWKGAGFEAWLFRIAYNLIVDGVRARDRELVRGDAEATLDIQVDPRPDPESAALWSETRSDLAGLVAALSEEQREVLLLRFAAGLDTNEVAAVMDRKVNAVRQLQFRALGTLRKRIEDEGRSISVG
jgi:RNA polymerase sigma-70 factor (ECF subfamily)